jgi:hypothetical protein
VLRAKVLHCLITGHAALLAHQCFTVNRPANETVRPARGDALQSSP